MNIEYDRITITFSKEDQHVLTAAAQLISDICNNAPETKVKHCDTCPFTGICASSPRFTHYSHPLAGLIATAYKNAEIEVIEE